MNLKNKQKNIPKGWQERKLEEISKIYDGTHQTPKYTEIGIPFLSVEHITANQFSDTKFISEDVYNKEIERVKIEKGDILMTRIGDIGTAKYISWDIKASFYVTLALLKTFDEGVNNKFLTYLINSQESQREIWKKTIHVAFPNKINLGDIGKCRMTFPPLPEQKRIVGVLEVWDRGIEMLERKIVVKENIKKGLLQRMMNCDDEQIVNDELSIVNGGNEEKKVFAPKLRLPGFDEPWEDRRLGEICDFIVDNRGKTPPIASKGIPLIEVNAIGQKNVDYLKINKFVDEEIYKTWFRKHLKNGDILFSTVGRTAMTTLYNSNTVACIAQNIVGLRFEEQNSNFMYYLLSEDKNNFKFKRIEMIAVQPSIKIPQMMKLKFLIPKIKEQKAIAEVFTTADEEIEALRKKLDVWKEQKKFLLNNLVTGNIKVPE